MLSLTFQVNVHFLRVKQQFPAPKNDKKLHVIVYQGHRTTTVFHKELNSSFVVYIIRA